HDELPELDELLELFAGHHVPELERLHPPLGAIAHCLERLDAALLARKISRVEVDGVQGASEGIEGRAGPRVVLSRPVGHRPVAGVPLSEESVDVPHRVGDRLLLVDHLAQAHEPRQRFDVKIGRASCRERGWCCWTWWM